MKSPFRKLIRISVVLFVLVLLFNFFGYYFNRIRSLENKELIEAINRSGRQQTLSQLIAKEVILLLNSPEKKNAGILKDTLWRSLTLFQAEQQILQKQAGSTPLPVPQRIFQIKLLLSSAQQFFEPMIAIGQELTQADSSLLMINKNLYMRNMLYNEEKYSSLMSEVTMHYSDMVNENSERTFDFTQIGKLKSDGVEGKVQELKDMDKIPDLANINVVVYGATSTKEAGPYANKQIENVKLFWELFFKSARANVKGFGYDTDAEIKELVADN